MSANLTGVNVLVTRPAHQVEPLCQLLKTHGAQPWRLPTLAIEDCAASSGLANNSLDWMQLDWLLFVSPNAVAHALAYLPIPLPNQLRVAAVGNKTAAALAEHGIHVICGAAPYTSETLLAVPELQAVAGQQILIVRGVGGRELLAETLQQRGAQVNYCDVYQRVCPPTPNWVFDAPIDIAVTSSQQGLENLFAMLQGCAWLPQTPLVVMSERIRPIAQQLSRAKVWVAPQAGDEGLVQAVLKWQAANKR